MSRRIVIAGGPRTGKSTLARKLSGGATTPLISTDSYNNLPWDQRPDAIAEAMRKSDNFVAEGTHMARVLRRHPDLAQGTTIYYMSHPVCKLTPKQASYAKGLRRQWLAVRPTLKGAIIVNQPQGVALDDSGARNAQQAESEHDDSDSDTE